MKKFTKLKFDYDIIKGISEIKNQENKSMKIVAIIPIKSKSSRVKEKILLK